MDCSENDYQTIKQIHESFSTVKKFVTNIYGYLPSDFCSLDGAMQDAATDDAVHVYQNSNIQIFTDDTWSPNNTIDDKFSHYYKGIHDANYYLRNMLNLKFEDWQYGDDYESWMKDYANYEYEVRFLRAFFYFELVKRYQNIPLVLDVLTQQQANQAIPVTADEIFDFIIKECTEIAEVLPINYDEYKEKEYGRVTKGVALALKTKASLYAASPLLIVLTINPNGEELLKVHLK